MIKSLSDSVCGLRSWSMAWWRTHWSWNLFLSPDGYRGLSQPSPADDRDHLAARGFERGGGRKICDHSAGTWAGWYAGLEHVRSQSLFGLSDIKCYFRWESTITPHGQEVINRCNSWPAARCAGAVSPPGNAIGEVFRYTLSGPGYTLQELKTAQDWVLERQFKQVPGVIDVVSFGGESKQYHVEADPFRMRARALRLNQLQGAIKVRIRTSAVSACRSASSPIRFAESVFYGMYMISKTSS